MECTAANKGYLREDFRLFHLSDNRPLPGEPHYHEFDKVVLLYAGSAEYTVEGVRCELKPGDILFVRHHDVHRAVIDGCNEYERVVLWITPEILNKYRDGEKDLEHCFETASGRRVYLYHPAESVFAQLKDAIQLLESSTDAVFGGKLLRDAAFVQLMVQLNCCVIKGAPESPARVDPQIDRVLRYINANLQDDLQVDKLSAMCYLSRYYFMRRFKDVTGYTVHGYIQIKRLTAAAELLAAGASVSFAAEECGFRDYSAFLRAFRKQFGVPPGTYSKGNKDSLESEYQE